MTILDSTEWLHQMRNYSGSGDYLDEANSHDAQFGSTSGADANDPLAALLSHADGNAWFRGTSLHADRWNTTSPSSADVADGETATVALWVYIRNMGQFDRVFASKVSNNGMRLSVNTDETVWAFGDGTNGGATEADAAAPIADGWHHFVLTIDHGAADIVTFWIDGVAQVDTHDISAFGTLNHNSDFRLFGESNDATAFSGDCASFEYYKDLATSSEISTVSDGGVGTLFAGTLSSPSMIVDMNKVTEPHTAFTDPQGNSWTINHSASGLVGTIVDRGWALLTTDDFFEIPDDAQLDFAAGDAGTWMVMFRTNTVASGSNVLMSKKDNLTTSAGYALVRNTANGQGIIADGTADDDDTVATIAIHTTHTLAMVRNTTDDDIEVFLDGVPSGSATTDSTTSTLANALVQRLGATSGSTAANFFEGVIGADAGWRSALTDTEVLEAHLLLTALPAFPPFARRQNRLVRM